MAAAKPGDGVGLEGGGGGDSVLDGGGAELKGQVEGGCAGR